MAEIFLFPSGQKPLMLKSGPLLCDPEDCPVYLDREELAKHYAPGSLEKLLAKIKAAIEAKPEHL